MSLGLIAAIGAHSIFEEVVGFVLYGFSKENYLCLLSLVIIVLHVILSDKVLRLYCLNDTNLKPWYVVLALISMVCSVVSWCWMSVPRSIA